MDADLLGKLNLDARECMHVWALECLLQCVNDQQNKKIETRLKIHKLTPQNRQIIAT